MTGDDFPCHESVAEATDSILVDMVAGIFVFSSLAILGGLFHGVLLGETRSRMLLYQGIVLCVCFA